MAEIVITEFMDEGAVRRLSAEYDTRYDAGLVERPEEMERLAAGARALIVRNRTQVRGPLLEAASGLKCIGRLGVGLDNIDVEACRERGIKVYPATGANDLAVAEYVITSAMMLLRGAYGSSDEIAGGAWPRQNLIGREMAGKVLGLVGYGAIAQEVAWRAHMMGMQIVAFDPYLAAGHQAWQIARNVALDGVLELADVISVHTPLTDETRHMFNAGALSRMKPGAVLINAARGGIVDEAALCDAIRAGKLGGAALDVFEQEPVDAAAGEKFKGLANLILTPHVAGVTAESNVRVSYLIAEKIIKHLKGTA